MKRQISTLHFLSALGALLIVVWLAPFSFAQSQSQSGAQPTAISNLYLVRVTRVKLESAREYSALMQNETTPALKKGGVKLRNALTPTAFGEAGEYIFVEPVESPDSQKAENK